MRGGSSRPLAHHHAHADFPPLRSCPKGENKSSVAEKQKVGGGRRNSPEKSVDAHGDKPERLSGGRENDADSPLQLSAASRALTCSDAHVRGLPVSVGRLPAVLEEQQGAQSCPKAGRALQSRAQRLLRAAYRSRPARMALTGADSRSLIYACTRCLCLVLVISRSSSCLSHAAQRASSRVLLSVAIPRLNIPIAVLRRKLTNFLPRTARHRLSTAHWTCYAPLYVDSVDLNSAR